MERLPSLNSIRIFETVARLLSYTAAAKELHVTTSALSHRIKALEQELGVTLIKRTPQRVILTAIGRQYYDQIAEGLTQLTSATNALHRAKGARILRIAAAPSLAARWLMGRLERFKSAHPDIHVELSSSRRPLDFTHSQFDIGIGYLRTIPSGLNAIPIGKNYIFPVCSPRLLEEPHALRTPADLKHHTLIDAIDFPDIDETFSLWSGWLKAAHHPRLTARKQTYMSPRWLMLQAVEQGLGVGLARTLPVSDDLMQKRLICPFGPAFPATVNTQVACAESTARNPEIVLFRDWVVGEAKESLAAVKRLIDLPKSA